MRKFVTSSIGTLLAMAFIAHLRQGIDVGASEFDRREQANVDRAYANER